MSNVVKSAQTAIRNAAIEAAVTIIAVKGKLALVIREQVEILEAEGLPKKEIATIVREALEGTIKRNTVNAALAKMGIRTRGKRSDAGHLKSADRLLKECMEPKKARAKKDEEEGEEQGMTAEELAELLASLDRAVVATALKLAGISE
jgi:hypothetical protein